MSSQIELVYCYKHDEGFARMMDTYAGKCSDGCLGESSEVHGWYDPVSKVRTMLFRPVYYESLKGGFEDWCWEQVIENYLNRINEKIA